MLDSLRTLHQPDSLAMPWGKSTSASATTACDFTVGIAGTFDVQNYGDLLFPLIAAAALEQRDPRIRVVPFSVNGRSKPSWPFQVRSMEDMMASISSLSAMLIGGGQIVRFDKSYPVPTPANIDLPFAYWLTPAVLAAMIGKPVLWNAVGASVGWLHSAWHDALLRQVFAASYFIGVRDAISRDDLAKLAPDASIQLLPDTAFGLSRLWPLAEESAEFTNWRTALGLEGKYVVLQASAAIAKHRSNIESLLESMGNINAVVLPVCWCHGDRAEAFAALKGNVFLSREWPGPGLIREIIGRSELIVASSLHACITALSYGVPVAQVPTAWGRTKFALLDEFKGIAPIDKKEALSQLIHRGRRIEPRVIECADRLDRYWDEVKNVVLQPPVEHGNLSRALMLGWAAKVCGDQKHLEPALRLVVSLRESLAGHFPRQRGALRRACWNLKSSSGTALRRINRIFSPPIAEPTSAEPKSGTEQAPGSTEGIATGKSLSEGGRTLNLHRIAQQKLETKPYQWASINHLFSMEDAASLAASFPRDKFKKVKGYDGEKGFEYMSRSLIHMGASVVTHAEGLSPAWRALAGDLLSADYRSALQQITGANLTSAPMEVNVIHYGPGAFMGPHVDLKAKIMTHVLYFNETWDPQQGGCIHILKSANPDDVFTQVLPVVGNSVLLVRSKKSWHSVSRVAQGCLTSRRSLNVIFHRPGSVSTMWPPGDRPVLEDYAPAA